MVGAVAQIEQNINLRNEEIQECIMIVSRLGGGGGGGTVVVQTILKLEFLQTYTHRHFNETRTLLRSRRTYHRRLRR